MRLSQGKKTETGLFNSHSVHFCTFVYTQVIGPSLRSASFPLGVPGSGDYAQFKRKMVAGFVMVMVGMRDWFDEYKSSKDFACDVSITKIYDFDDHCNNEKDSPHYKKLTSFLTAGAFGAFAVDALARLAVLSTTAL